MPVEVDFQKLDEASGYLVPLNESVWLMDNHKWALLVWETHRLGTGDRYALLHADFHWDGVDDFSESDEEQAKLLNADLDKLRVLTAQDEYIRYDSFIAPAVRRGTLAELHFYCLQDDGSDEGVDADLCDDHDALQVVHESAESFAAVKPSQPVIFDLCLDLFNRSDMDYEGELWADEEVVVFLESVRHHIQTAALVTISLSFGCSGTKDDTRHLAELVVPRILAMRT